MLPFMCSNVSCALILQHLRQAGIAGKFVEFFGPGVSQLSAPDRTTIANMCPEYNATISFFPVDQVTLKHFKQTSESVMVILIWSSIGTIFSVLSTSIRN